MIISSVFFQARINGEVGSACILKVSLVDRGSWEKKGGGLVNSCGVAFEVDENRLKEAATGQPFACAFASLIFRQCITLGGRLIGR